MPIPNYQAYMRSVLEQIADGEEHQFRQIVERVCDEFILNSKQSTNLASINSTQLKAFPIATPNCVEQLEIENRLKSVDNMISSYKDELNKQSLQKQGLMQDLLTGKVSVQ
ncbi:MAG: restriction endonuclease Mrr [Cocleimonas sp.]|jgi:restriction endonuclease Mrr